MNTSSVRRPTYPYRFEAAVRRAAWGWFGRQIAAFVAALVVGSSKPWY
jgi:hypothetical protein